MVRQQQPMAGAFQCLVCEQPSPRPIHQGVCWSWASPEQRLEARQMKQQVDQLRDDESMDARWGQGEHVPVECPPHQWEADARGRPRWSNFSGDGLNIGVRCLKCRRAKLIVEKRFAEAVYAMVKDERDSAVEEAFAGAS